MSPLTREADRRSQDGHAAVIEHALKLAHRFGWRYAMLYLLNQGLELGTIDRVLFGEIERRRAILRLVGHGVAG